MVLEQDDYNRLKEVMKEAFSEALSEVDGRIFSNIIETAVETVLNEVVISNLMEKPLKQLVKENKMPIPVNLSCICPLPCPWPPCPPCDTPPLNLGELSPEEKEWLRGIVYHGEFDSFEEALVGLWEKIGKDINDNVKESRHQGLENWFNELNGN